MYIYFLLQNNRYPNTCTCTFFCRIIDTLIHVHVLFKSSEKNQLIFFFSFFNFYFQKCHICAYLLSNWPDVSAWPEGRIEYTDQCVDGCVSPVGLGDVLRSLQRHLLDVSIKAQYIPRYHNNQACQGIHTVSLHWWTPTRHTLDEV